MTDSTLWFTTFNIKENKIEEFFSFLKTETIDYSENYRLGNEVGLYVWNEPYNNSFWDKVKEFCTNFSASEYRETGENIQYPEEKEDGN